MCYLSCEPALDWSDDEPVSDLTSILDCIDPYWRSLRRVVFNSGPTVTGKQTTTDGGTAWTVTFTAVAGNPYEFGAEVPIVEGFGKAAEPYVCDPPGVSTMTGSVVPDSGCAPVSFVPVFDPLCPAFVEPPTYPSVPLGCYDPPSNWMRRQFTIPEEFVPLWGEVVPRIEVHAGAANVRNLRLRFYADVDRQGTLVGAVDPDTGEVLGDPCGYCGDLLVSYVPANQTLVIDGTDELVYVEAAGGTGQRRADSLVFSAFRDASGTTVTAPMVWPSLSCGFGYIVTVDTEQTANLPSVDLSLYPKAV
jgi:hypothetical protein